MKNSIVFMDKDMIPTTKDKAVYVRIVEYDKNGVKNEVFGEVNGEK